MPEFKELIVGKVVGKTGPAGADGKSPYQIAVEGGWSGSEHDFNAALANVGDIGALLDTINGEVV